MQIARWVQLRMDRQTVLHREVPPRFTMIIDESVLRRGVGSPDVSRRQLAHLLDCAELPHLDLRVLLGKRRCARQSQRGIPGIHHRGARSGDRYAETVGGAVYVEPPGSERFVRVYDRTWRISSYSTNGGGSCVEAGALGDATGRVAVRHSHHRDGLVIVIGRLNWTMFIDGLKNENLAR